MEDESENQGATVPSVPTIR